ncbi:MAG: radical SAM protein [Coriobacteriia bacterium]|nr:radical SAM protein [Coriobacteriia bacterium]
MEKHLLTTILRAVLARSLKPFVFESTDHSPALDLDVPHLGAYVHIPFCETLCPFCPYYKVAYGDGSAMPAYLDALEREIARVLGRSVTPLSSVYFGGGTPALAGEGIGRIIRAIKFHAEIAGEIGLELHPRDVAEDFTTMLLDAGVTMVSLGVQSFQPHSLAALGRPTDPSISVAALGMLGTAGFSAVDVDLIFGIPGQSDDDLRRDFARAVELGATQVSTYPFIDFSYASNRIKPVSERRKQGLMSVLLKSAEENGFTRGSVWTFRRRGTPSYSSITRDDFVGFGASATTLLRDQFKVNTFDVDGYISAVGNGRLPTAYTLRFSPRARRAYWLFWSCYNMDIGRDRFSAFFGAELDEEFGGSLALAKALGIMAPTADGYTLTGRGAYWFHVIEQLYTHQYIDKTWRVAMSATPPRRIMLW